MDLLTARIDIDKLDPKTRAQWGLPSKGTASGRRKGSRKEVPGPGLPVVCHACGEPCDGETKQKDHMAEFGHHRFQALTG